MCIRDRTRAAAASSAPVYGGDFDFDTIRMIALDLDGTTLTRNGLDVYKRQGLHGAGYCTACFNGDYPTEIPETTSKNRFESKISAQTAREER